MPAKKSNREKIPRHVYPKLEAVLELAQEHGKDADDWTYWIGDLEEILRDAWSVMSPAQRSRILNLSETVGELQGKE